jgi:hypothetical protein
MLGYLIIDEVHLQLAVDEEQDDEKDYKRTTAYHEKAYSSMKSNILSKYFSTERSDSKKKGRMTEP